MPTVVPSEVVRIIDVNFDWAAGTEPAPRLDINHIGRVSAVIALVDSRHGIQRGWSVGSHRPRRGKVECSRATLMAQLSSCDMR